MKEPTLSDGITFDANAFITYSLIFGQDRDYFAEPLHMLVEQCKKKRIAMGYFDVIKGQAYRNLTKAINNFTSTRGKYYLSFKFKEKAVEILNRLFSEIPVLSTTCAKVEFVAARQFFIQHETDVQKALQLQHVKSNIPEDHDIELLVWCHNCAWKTTYLVSDDGHFIAYAPEIEKSTYSVHILPMKDIRQTMLQWKWIR